MAETVDEAAARSLIRCARDISPVSGLTHTFYRYPARFSPKLVRAVIETFTLPGDLVVDPFVGGGTTLVESLALGRDAIGTDISSLATFVSDVKTRLYSDADLAKLTRWIVHVEGSIDMWRSAPRGNVTYEDAGYLRHLSSSKTWRLRKAIEQALESAQSLSTKKLESFARCSILRTAQWALDGRKRLPTICDFRETLSKHTSSMIEGARELRIAAEISSPSKPSEIKCLNRSSNGLERTQFFRGQRKPKLIVTSPPYPGVHVLYHRWQVDGRKETPAPFWIANKLDGDGAAYYTLGARNAPQLNTYFANLRMTLRSVAALCAPDTMIVQVVAFSEPSWQLPRYLSIADDVGLRECYLPQSSDSSDGRLWRSVPNRKWYANQRGETNGSQEVVLFHQLATD
jgi:hypothetical protein